MKNKKQPKQLWAFWANQSGPWFKTARKAIYDEELGVWWYKKYNEVEKIGLTFNKTYIYVCYSSVNKKDVDLFISGFNSCRAILAPFFKE